MNNTKQGKAADAIELLSDYRKTYANRYAKKETDRYFNTLDTHNEIVRSVNSFDSLVEACKVGLGIAIAWESRFGTDANVTYDIGRIEEALRKAREL